MKKIIRKKKDNIKNNNNKLDELFDVIKNEPSSIILNSNLNSNNLNYICRTPFSTIELEIKFGNPSIVNEYNYEYKFEYNNNIYSIYDWKDDKEYYYKNWYIAM